MERKGLVYGMPEATYHAPKDELSSTGAKLLLDCPAKFKYQVLDGNRVHRASYDLGTAVHTKVLGVGAEFITYPTEHLTKSGNASTAAKTVAWADEQRATGKVILSPADGRVSEAMSEAVLSHPLARKLFEREGKSEVSVFDDSYGIKRRGRFDYLPDDGGIAVDLKTTMDASPSAFARSVAKFGYHIQRGHYLDILKRATGRELDMLFVTVEKDAPYLVAVHKVSQQFAEMGEVEALDAAGIYRRCMEADEWPGHPVKINELAPPMGAIYDHQDRYESGEIQIA